jgi:hypothetical protein
VLRVPFIGREAVEGRRPAVVEFCSSLISKELKEEEEMGQRRLDGGNEEDGAEESGRRRRTVRRRRPGVMAARARPRKKKNRVGQCWAERPRGAGWFRWE